MLLTTRNLPNYLLSKGLISYDSIVDGDLTISDASHRNRAFRVLRDSHPSYFVKQIKPGHPSSSSAWQQEDACYRRLSSSGIMPKHHASDFDSLVLVLELVHGSETLSQYHGRLPSCPAEAGRKQGEVLSTFHRATGNSQEASKTPWILAVHETNPEWFESLSLANARLLEVVRNYPEYGELLNGLRSEWQPSCLIHGDVKWDNFLIRNTASAMPSLLLIDWEMASFGDPCWDAGAIFQAYLNFWIYSMPFHQTTRPDLLVSRAHRPLERLHPAIHAFWNSYVAGMRFSAAEARARLSRSIRCGAARMIQTAYEMMHHSREMPAAGVALLQISFNILTRPADAIADLFGFVYV